MEYKGKIRLGETHINNQNQNMTIIEYKDCHHIKIQFEDGTIVETQYASFLKGEPQNRNIENEPPTIERLGEEKYNNQGCLMKIIEYNNSHNITIEFQDYYKSITHTNYVNFKKGSVNNPTFLLDKITKNKEGCLMKCIKHLDSLNIVVEFQDEWKFQRRAKISKFINKSIKNPYAKTILSIACIGNTSSVISKGRKKQSYCCWYSMLQRCYRYDGRFKAYEDCEVCKEWLCYENFEKWWNANYKEYISHPQLDKDIIKFNNRVYSPKYCAIIPRELNVRIGRFWNRNIDNNGCLFGVSYDKKSNKYFSRIRVNDKVEQKTFKNEEDCFNWYLSMKDIELNRIAEEYKDIINEKVYIGLKEQVLNLKIELYKGGL